jgi:hypothetical protein
LGTQSLVELSAYKSGVIGQVSTHLLLSGFPYKLGVAEHTETQTLTL